MGVLAIRFRYVALFASCAAFLLIAGGCTSDDGASSAPSTVPPQSPTPSGTAAPPPGDLIQVLVRPGTLGGSTVPCIDLVGAMVADRDLGTVTAVKTECMVTDGLRFRHEFVPAGDGVYALASVEILVLMESEPPGDGPWGCQAIASTLMPATSEPAGAVRHGVCLTLPPAVDDKPSREIWAEVPADAPPSPEPAACWELARYLGEPHGVPTRPQLCTLYGDP